MIFFMNLFQGNFSHVYVINVVLATTIFLQSKWNDDVTDFVPIAATCEVPSALVAL